MHEEKGVVANQCLKFKLPLKGNGNTSVNKFRKTEIKFYAVSNDSLEGITKKKIWHMDVQIFIFKLKWSFSGKPNFDITVKTTL